MANGQAVVINLLVLVFASVYALVEAMGELIIQKMSLYSRDTDVAVANAAFGCCRVFVSRSAPIAAKGPYCPHGYPMPFKTGTNIIFISNYTHVV